MLNSLCKWFQRRLESPVGEKLQTLPTPLQVDRMLQRARARADRAQEPLSVIVFLPRESDQTQQTWTRLVAILEERLRITDDVGWLDEHTLCAILPGTSREGALKVADDVCVHFPQELPPPQCTVYTYPFDPHWSQLEPSESAPEGSQPDRVISLELLFLQPLPLWKRGVDVVGALTGLLVLFPLLCLIALLIKLTSAGPIFFRQRRTGLGGEPFWIYKFRTMVPNAEARQQSLRPESEQDGPAFKIRRDPRVTFVGRFLRSFSLDELPQLWNVLRGDMTLVGPRPLPCQEAHQCDGWQRRRQDVTPGLTCIWQVRGRSRVQFDDWVRMDLQYARSRSILHDLKLLLLTLPAVLMRRGAH